MKKVVYLVTTIALVVMVSLCGCSSGNAKMQDAAVDAVIELQKSLKRPSSLELNEVFVVDMFKARDKFVKEVTDDKLADNDLTDGVDLTSSFEIEIDDFFAR